jgi:molecular chaperone GrpE
MAAKKSLPNDPKETALKNEFAQLKQQIAELTDALQRERADAINVRRHADQERIKMASYHKTAVVRELLPVIDNFERALKHVPPELADNDYVKGVRGIVKQFEKTLQAMGVEKIKTLNEPFDPRYHEAVQMEEGEGTREIISEELQPGYRLGDEVIRHAMVKVKLA